MVAFLGGAGILAFGVYRGIGSVRGLVSTLILATLWIAAVAWDAWRCAHRPHRSAPRAARWLLLVPLLLLDHYLADCFFPAPGDFPRPDRLIRPRYRFCRAEWSSMVPRIRPGDRLVVDTWDTVPRRQDLIVFKAPVESDLTFWIKRCVAVEGDLVEIRAGTLYLDGRAQGPVAPPRHSAGDGARPDRCGPVRIPPGTIFCLGDNGADSYDSRFWGPLPVTEVCGKVRYTWWHAGMRE